MNRNPLFGFRKFCPLAAFSSCWCRRFGDDCHRGLLDQQEGRSEQLVPSRPYRRFFSPVRASFEKLWQNADYLLTLYATNQTYAQCDAGWHHRDQLRSAARAKLLNDIKDYDFVIVGFGNAGRSALATLEKECPSATIALVDPLHSPSNFSSTRDNKVDRSSPQVEYYSDSATRLNPSDRVVCLDGDHRYLIRYNHALLIATGARGAPPPSYLLDVKANDSVLELRSTALPYKNHQNQHRPVLAMGEARRRVSEASSKGNRICVLGSGWEALDLAVLAAIEGRKAVHQSLVFGGSGPVSHVLPSYLSSAVTKRLKSMKIDVQNRTLVKYVMQGDASVSETPITDQLQSPCIHLYTAKSYDFLDSQRITLDLLVVSPDTSGSRGSAALPTLEVPDHLVDSAAGRPWYRTWAQLSMVSIDDPCRIVCYRDDSRVVVNGELCACSGVYAAGSVAKYANGLSGHANVAGVGRSDGATAGRIAARNMAGIYYRHQRHQGSRRAQKQQPPPPPPPLPSIQDPVPMWRSDLLPFQATDSDDSHPGESTLSLVGITALCVGECDSERFATHGVWWTHPAIMTRLVQGPTVSQGTKTNDNPTSCTISPERTRRRTRPTRKSVKPVYGVGVVYYLDGTGGIQGIMTWGIPFKTHPQGLNMSMVHRMKEIVKSNRTLDLGQSTSSSSSSSSTSPKLLSEMLSRFSQELVVLSLAGQTGAKDTTEGLTLPRALHRFTEVRPSLLRRLALLPEGSHNYGKGSLGDALFARYEHYDTANQPAGVADSNSAVNATTTTTATPTSTPDSAHPENYHDEWVVWREQARQWDLNEDRARPPREDLLWIRKGDEGRAVSAHDTRVQAFHKAFGSGPPPSVTSAGR